jgi:hypothetical protein
MKVILSIAVAFLMVSAPVVAQTVSVYPLPTAQSVVQGSSIEFRFDAAALCTRAQWTVGTNKLTTAQVPPYTATYRPTAAPRRYTVKASCFGPDGKELGGSSGPLDVTVKPVEPPPVEPVPPPVEPTPPPPTDPLPPPPTTDVRTLPLVTKEWMVYKGAFRYPLLQTGIYTFGYSGPFNYNQTNNSIVAVGHDWYQQVAEFTIPEFRIATTVAGLERAVALQPFADPTGGKLKLINPLDPNAKKVGGVLPLADKWIVSAYSYYDGSMSATSSHFVAPTKTAEMATTQGPFRVGTMNPGLVAGYMAAVPEEWQALLGGKAVTGQCCLAIINRSSSGPALFVFNPDDVGTVVPAPVVPLVYYPPAFPLGKWGTTNDYHNGTTSITGVAFPKGSRSVVFFGTHGTGTFCYGAGTKDPALAKPAVTNATGGIIEDAVCYDPEVGSKGGHAYPYAARAWAYDALDFIEVKEGRKQPWEIRPYAFWDNPFPIAGTVPWLKGATYDRIGNRLFVGQPKADGDASIIHGFQFIPPPTQ